MWGKKFIISNTVILIKVKMQYINDVVIPARASNQFISGTIRFVAVYVCDVTHDEILETII